MKDLGTHIGTLAIIGGTAAYLFTHEPYVPIERETSPSRADLVTLKIKELCQEIHEDFLRLEAKLDSANYLMDQKIEKRNSAR